MKILVLSTIIVICTLSILTGCDALAPAPVHLSIDTDGDGWTNSQEEKAGTNIRKKDTDGDGYWDPKDHNPIDPNIPILPNKQDIL